MVNGNAADELAILFPAERSITIAGRVVQIKRCGIAQSSRVRELGMPILQREDVDGGRSFEAFLADCPEEANALIVAATGLDAQWIAALNDEDRYELASQLAEVNGSFFAQVRLPQWARIHRGRMGLLGLGPMGSSASSNTDTPILADTPESKPSATSMPSLAQNGMPAAPA
jgi:hypothetical protein